MPSNEQRINTAFEALAVIRADDEHEQLTDLLANLLHWSDATGTDFDRALAMARLHFEAEQGEACPVCGAPPAETHPASCADHTEKAGLYTCDRCDGLHSREFSLLCESCEAEVEESEL
jgi:hypothetical protein